MKKDLYIKLIDLAA